MHKIWEEIKNHGMIHIMIAMEHQPRLIRAIRHESHKDTIFRLKCVEAGCAYSLHILRSRNSLKIHLVMQDKIPKRFISGFTGHSPQ